LNSFPVREQCEPIGLFEVKQSHVFHTKCKRAGMNPSQETATRVVVPCSIGVNTSFTPFMLVCPVSPHLQTHRTLFILHPPCIICLSSSASSSISSSVHPLCTLFFRPVVHCSVRQVAHSKSLRRTSLMYCWPERVLRVRAQ
jgi:hypothetical protein